jgi:hypothetical protein
MGGTHIIERRKPHKNLMIFVRVISVQMYLINSRFEMDITLEDFLQFELVLKRIWYSNGKLYAEGLLVATSVENYNVTVKAFHHFLGGSRVYEALGIILNANVGIPRSCFLVSCI